MTKFKNYSAYREWLAYWRRDNAELCARIKMLKVVARTSANNWRVRAAMSELRSLQMTARSIMIARNAVVADYKAQRNTQELQAAANPLNDRVELAHPTDARA